VRLLYACQFKEVRYRISGYGVVTSVLRAEQI